MRTELSLSSNQVIVFPCVSRKTNNDDERDNKAKVLSEENITNIIKSVVDNDSYVIKYNSGILECIIGGYYFNVSLESGNYRLELDFRDDGGNYKLLKGDNESEKFAGLKCIKYSDEEFENPKPNGPYLEVELERNGNYKAYPHSKYSISIDCGRLE